MKKQNGITLIALVITIIVLLILAGVSINLVVGQNGVLNKSTESVVKTEYASLDEEIESKLAEKQIDTFNPSVANKNLGEYLKTIPDATVEQLAEDTWCVTKGNTQITVTENGEKTEGKLEVWDGTSVEVPEITGFEWKIYTAAQLKFFADVVNSGGVLTDEQKTAITTKGYAESDLVITDETVVALMNDIDLGARQKDGVLTSGTAWIPIGPSNALKFTGTFEGNNHVIKGLYVNVEKYGSGLFGNSDTIQNLTIKDSYIEGQNAVAGISGYVREGYVKNCHNINTTVVQKEGEYYVAGGIVGQCTGLEISNCSNTGNIKASAYSYSSTYKLSYVGGIVGCSIVTSIENCKNDGEIYGKGAGSGGIGGYLHQTTISNCYNTDKVDSLSSGGVAGVLDGTMNNCYNTGEIIGLEYNTGGVLGELKASSEMNNCYNSGSVTGEDFVGGILGRITGTEGSIVKNNYNKGMVVGTTQVGAVLGGQATIGVNTLNNLYYLESVGIGAVTGADDETNNIVSISNDFNTLEEFLTWIENQ